MHHYFSNEFIAVTTINNFSASSAKKLLIEKVLAN